MTTNELRELRNAVKDQWISVTDKLPEFLGDYLVTVDLNCPVKHERFVAVSTYDAEAKSWSPFETPIAWMPLSRPYKA